MEVGSAFRRRRNLNYEKYYPRSIYTRDRIPPRRWVRALKKVHKGLRVRWNSRDSCWDVWLKCANGANIMFALVSGMRHIGPEMIDALYACKRNRGMRGKDWTARALAKIAAERAKDNAEFRDMLKRNFSEWYDVKHGGRIQVPTGIGFA